MQIRVYYEDTDVGKSVYYANYLKYMERGRTEFLREIGFPVSRMEESGFNPVVSETHVRFRRSARLEDLIDVDTSLVQLTPITMSFGARISDQQGELLVESLTKVVVRSAASDSVTELPEPMKAALTPRLVAAPLPLQRWL